MNGLDDKRFMEEWCMSKSTSPPPPCYSMDGGGMSVLEGEDTGPLDFSGSHQEEQELPFVKVGCMH